MARRTWMPAVLALGLAFTNVQGDDPSPAPSKIPSLMRKRLDAAQKAFKSAWDDKGGDIEAAYRWSCRWLEAERESSDKTEARIAGLRAHLARMTEIDQVTKREYLQKITTSYEVRTTEYYVAEAELWVCQALDQSGGKGRTTSAR